MRVGVWGAGEVGTARPCWMSITRHSILSSVRLIQWISVVNRVLARRYSHDTASSDACESSSSATSASRTGNENDASKCLIFSVVAERRGGWDQ